MSLYPDELRDIAEAIEAYQAFFRAMLKDRTVTIEWPADVDVSFDVVASIGKALGKIGWSEDGEIAFMPKEASNGVE